MVRPAPEIASAERRKPRSITDADIEVILDAIETREKFHQCRFGDIDPDDMDETIRFCKNANKFIEDGKSTLWKGFLIIILGAMAGVFWLGFLAKVQK